MKQSAKGVYLEDGTSVEDAITAGVVEEWHFVGDVGEPAFEDGEEADSGLLAALGGLRFYRDRDRCHMEGVAKMTGAGTVFTLPSGYRPEFTVSVPTASCADATGATVGTWRGAIAATGEVIVQATDQDNLMFALSFRI